MINNIVKDMFFGQRLDGIFYFLLELYKGVAFTRVLLCGNRTNEFIKKNNHRNDLWFAVPVTLVDLGKC